MQQNFVYDNTQKFGHYKKKEKEVWTLYFGCVACVIISTYTNGTTSDHPKITWYDKKKTDSKIHF